MTFPNPWSAPGFFAKAHLHTHSTESDGKLPAARVAGLHFQCGYSILAITDHSKVTDTRDLARDGMVTIPGGEVGCRTRAGDGFHHVVALGVSAETLPKDGIPVLDVLNGVHEAGGLAFLAHPYWSCNTVDDLVGLPHCFGVEVYNHGCEVEIGKGLSSVHWDDALQRGARYLPIAVDDAHMYGHDVLGGWTWIRVPELTAVAALDALRAGLFYASCGPEIRDLRVENGVIYVETTPAAFIRFVCDNQHGWCEGAWGRPPLESARYVLSGRERYVRVEVVDQAGRRAWSPPIFAE